MKAGAFIASLAGKAGLDATDKDLVDILSSAEFAQKELPDTITSKITASLINQTEVLDLAKNNAEVKDYFTARALNATDTIMEKLYDEYGFDDDMKAAMKAEKSTFKRVELLTKKVQEIELKKASAGGKDKDGYAKTINELNEKIGTLTNDFKKQLVDQATAHNSEISNQMLVNMLASKPFADELKHLSPDVNIQTALNLINNELQSKGAKAIRNGKDFKLVQAADEALDFIEAGQKVDFPKFVDGVLARNKFIKVSEPGKVVPPVNKVGVPGDGAPKVSAKLSNAVDESLKDLETAVPATA